MELPPAPIAARAPVETRAPIRSGPVVARPVIDRRADHHDRWRGRSYHRDWARPANQVARDQISGPSAEEHVAPLRPTADDVHDRATGNGENDSEIKPRSHPQIGI